MMYNRLCHFGNSGFLGNFGIGDLIGFILTMVFLGGLLLTLTLLVVLAVRRARGTVTSGPNAPAQPNAKEILQAQYARGELSRDQYELKKQALG